MRLLLFVLLFFPTVLCAQTQSEAVDYIKSSLPKIKSDFPKLTPQLTFKDIYVTGNDLFVKFQLEDSNITLESYVKSFEGDKATVIAYMLNFDKRWPDYFFKSNLNLKYIFLGLKTKENKTLVYTSDEIKKSYEEKYPPLLFLNNIVSQVKKILPQEFGNGLKWTDIYIKDNYLTYHFQSDGSVYKPEEMRQAKINSLLLGENLIIKSLNNPNYQFEKSILYYVQKCGIGFRYLYSFANSSDTVFYLATPEEIKKEVKEIKLSEIGD